MEIAIEYEKYDLGRDKYLFKPIGVLKGKYDPDKLVYQSDRGLTYYPIDGKKIDTESFFGDLISIEDLKNCFGGDNIDIPKMISKLFEDVQDYCHIGVYNKDEECIQLYEMSYDYLVDYETLSDKDLSSSNSDEIIDSSGLIGINIDTLIRLKQCTKTDEVHDIVDSIIESYYPYLTKECKEKINSDRLSKKNKLELKKEESNRFNLKELKEDVLSRIIRQNDAVDAVTTTIAVNNMSKNIRHKSHILIAGPSGTGKTEMINVICDRMSIPCFKADATAYTQEGYVGKSVYSMLEGLINEANGNIAIAENGILIIDEIDKKASSKNDDVSGKSVLNSLLKIMDRDVIEIQPGNGLKGKPIMFDTSNLTIILMGAFSDIYEKKLKQDNKIMGFGSKTTAEKPKKMKLTNKDFIEYGMPAEFMGRIGTIAYTDEFRVEDLVEILYKSKISPINEEKEFFSDLGIKITFTSAYIKEIAKQAMELKTGARALKGLVHDSLKYAYEDVLMGDRNIKTLKLTKETALNNKKYYAK